jgi:thiol-disulfide isomerase/thioredoxin
VATHIPPQQPTQNPAAPTREKGGALAWTVLAAAVALFLAYVVWRPRIRAPMGVDHPVVGQRPFFFELEPLTGDGEPIGLDDLTGKVTLINIWGTWCPPCGDEFPYLAAIHEKLKSRPDFEYLSISYDDKPVAELKEATSEFLKRMRTDHPTYHDPGAKTLQAFNVLGIEDSFPTTLILDRSGTIRGVWLGYSRQSITEIERLLEKLIE